ncbi:PREDICTED: leucine-rich repeat extensin-like protein 3 [Nicotiana attenuata]|uniref:Prolamin-like domain-containing protein n=1 Tax=Nicotiana attenuata TaxID=49451 RepID=A0A314L9N1_NICAT|nr:PREDICTED: leucine-rich repeat extensin-like protein 3 [Nicotiana attenuata]OIT38292.1 hypothetical protein A4A49_21620 [Nicotiana attenuata]
MSRSGTLWVILFLGICMGMVTATAREPKSENVELFGRRWPPIPWWRLAWWVHYPNYPPLPPPPPSVANVIPPPVDAAPPPPPHPARPPPSLPLITNAVPPPSPPPHMAPPSPPPPHAATSLPPQPSPSLPPIDNVAPILPPPPPAFQSPMVNKPPYTRGDEPSGCSMVLINVDGCVSDLITSFFKDQVSLSVDCCRVISRISDDCFDAGFTHFRVPVFLTKVRDYCSHHPTSLPPPPSVDDNAVPPSPPPQHAAPHLPPHVTPSLPPQPPPSPPPVDNVAPILPPSPLVFHSPVVNPPTPPPPPPSPLHTAAPPLMPPHAAPSLPPQPPPSPPPVRDNMAPTVPPPPSSTPRGDETSDCSTVLINVDGCVSDLITSFFKNQVSLSADCCRVVSRISDDCFERAFTHFRVPVFQTKVRDYCSHHG